MKLRAMVCGWLAAAPLAAQPPSVPEEVKALPALARDSAAEAQAAFAKGDLEGAKLAYERMLIVAPDNLLALVNLGVTEFRLGNTQAAEELLKKAVRQKLESAPAWLTLGIIYMDENRLDEALAALSQAVLYDPRNPRARNYLGVVVGRKGWIDAAQAELRKALEIDPYYDEAHYNLAVFYLEEKPPSLELARRHYFLALELGAEPDAQVEKALEGTKKDSSKK